MIPVAHGQHRLIPQAVAMDAQTLQRPDARERLADSESEPSQGWIVRAPAIAPSRGKAADRPVFWLALSISSWSSSQASLSPFDISHLFI